jgi:hypothetical protein
MHGNCRRQQCPGPQVQVEVKVEVEDVNEVNEVKTPSATLYCTSRDQRTRTEVLISPP